MRNEPLRTFFRLAWALAVAAGCSHDNGPGSGGIVTVQVTPGSLTLPVSTAAQLTATLRDSAGQVLSGSVAWTSSDLAKATVSTQGVAVGVAVGSVTITATSNGHQGTCNVTVTAAPPPGVVDSVEVLPDSAVISVSGTVQLVATLRDSTGAIVSGQVQWVTSDATKATVSTTGLVTGVAPGTATITASSNGHQDTAFVTIATTGVYHVSFATYLGGSDDEELRDVAVDPQGNIYVTGNTISPNFPVTPGAFQTTLYNNGTPPVSDAFVAKLDPNGRIIWATYLGGQGFERGYGIEVDHQGYVIIAGRGGPGLPVTPGAFQTQFQGGISASIYGPTDGFVCKLTPDGSALVFCSWFGTSDPEILRDVAVDANNDIYIAGGSSTGTYPNSAAWFTNAYQKTRVAGEDIVLAKIKADGSQVLWATFLGGTGDEGAGPAVRVDGTGIYVTGNTNSTDLPTPNGYDQTANGQNDMHLAKFSLDGSQLLYGTYVGGSGNELCETHCLAIDAQGNAYIGGITTSTDFPTTPGAFQRTIGSTTATDAFISKISPDGGQLLASTYIGGTGGESAEGLAVDQLQRVWFAGNTSSPNFPVTVPVLGSGLSDLIGVQLAPDFSHLLLSFRWGSSGADFGRTALVDSQGNLYMGGQAGANNLPTVNAVQSRYGGGTKDGALARLAPGP